MPGQARLLPRLRGSFFHALPNRWQFFLWGIVGQRTKAGLPFSWRHHPVQASKPPWQQVRAALGRRLFKEEVLILYASPFRDSTNIQEFCCQNGIRVWEGKGIVAQVRTDSASYFAKSTVLQTFCQQKGIYQIYSPPYTQALNGVAERNVRSILDMTRALLLHAGAPVKLYQLAMEQCVKILNVISFRKPNDEPNMPMLSPLERWEGRSLPRQRSSLRVWGCAAYPLEHSANPDTFDPKAVLHVNLGNAHPHGWWLGTLPGFKVRAT